MVSPQAQEILDRIIGERIATLAALIRAQEEPCASFAIEQLSFIGTKAAAEMLAELFLELNDDVLAFTLLASPYRDDYNELLEQHLDPEALAEARTDLSSVDTSLMSMEPLIRSIVKAIEASSDDTCGER